jgi:hypothetical protein
MLAQENKRHPKGRPQMNREDIIRMAKEAGIYHAFDSEGQWDGLTDVQLIERHPLHPNDLVYGEKRTVEILERFAALVAAAEREACAKLADDKLMDTSALLSMPPKSSAAWSIAASIRARGQE